MRRAALLNTLAVFAAMTALAQTADDQDLKTVNAAFYNALSSRNEAAMDPLWVHAPYVATVHPISKAPVIGWDAVRQSWADVFKQFTTLTVTSEERMVHHDGNTAWVIGTETINGKFTNGTEWNGTALVTNVYQHQNGHWLMVIHHASNVPQ